jgi:hypothetical protein
MLTRKKWNRTWNIHRCTDHHHANKESSAVAIDASFASSTKHFLLRSQAFQHINPRSRQQPDHEEESEAQLHAIATSFVGTRLYFATVDIVNSTSATTPLLPFDNRTEARNVEHKFISEGELALDGSDGKNMRTNTTPSHTYSLLSSSAGSIVVDGRVVPDSNITASHPFTTFP